MKRLLPYAALAALACFAGGLAKVSPSSMPQVASGDDFLSVLLGDAKRDVSGAMIHQADSYFHGGVDMECHDLHDHGEHGHGVHAADSKCGHCRHEHGHRDAEAGFFDPWRWINSHVRAPEIERHLEGTKAIEMMPWFWVAVKSDPHNTEAWSTAWYVASRIMKDDALAMRIAAEGWRLNPGSMEMACTLGRAHMAKSTLDLEKSVNMFQKVLELGRNKKKLEQTDELSLYVALGHLAEYAKKRNDGSTLRRLLAEAQRVNPGHPTTLSIRKKLEQIGK